jgi:hypothetical protein
MEGVPQSAEDDVNLTSNDQFDIQSPEDTFMFDPELLLYVILKNILSEDD